MNRQIEHIALQFYLPLLTAVLFKKYDRQESLTKTEIIPYSQDVYHLIKENNLVDLNDNGLTSAQFIQACQTTLLKNNLVICHNDSYGLSDSTLLDWFIAKGNVILINQLHQNQYQDNLIDQLYSHKKDQYQHYLDIAFYMIDMLQKKETLDLKSLIEFIQKIVNFCDLINDDQHSYDYRMLAIKLLRRSQLDELEKCEYTNAFVHGLLSIHLDQREEILYKANELFLELEMRVSLLNTPQSKELLAKILSNIGAYYQILSKKTPDALDKAILYHQKALEIRKDIHSSRTSNSYLTLASDYYHQYTLTNNIQSLYQSLDYHLHAHHLSCSYVNLIRIAGTRIQIALLEPSLDMIEKIYDDLTIALKQARHDININEITHIKDNFKESLEIFQSIKCPTSLYSKIYSLASSLDETGHYYQTLVQEKI